MRALILALALCGATPALATEWEHCSDAGGAASFDYLAGDGDPVSVGQAFEDAEAIRIDALDKDAGIVASLRLFKASESGEAATGGTLSINGLGAWAVSCDPG